MTTNKGVVYPKAAKTRGIAALSLFPLSTPLPLNNYL